MNSHDNSYLEAIYERLRQIEQKSPEDKVALLIELNLHILKCLDEVDNNSSLIFE